MTATYLGSYTIGASMPGATVAVGAGSSGINAALPTLEDQLAGLMEYKPTAIVITEQIAQCQALITALQAQLTLGISPPSIALQVKNILDLIAALSATIGGINASLNIILAFQGLLVAAGLHLLTFAGDKASFGAELGALVAALPGPAQVQALVLLTSETATWDALGKIMKVGP